MRWPDRPTCHDADFLAHQFGTTVWRPGPQRSCSYCGSMHPADLLALLERGADLGGADWKFGWPHKFYVEEPEGMESRDLGAIKWYNLHLLDDGYDDEALTALLTALTTHSGITWARDEERGGVLQRPLPRLPEGGPAEPGRAGAAAAGD